MVAPANRHVFTHSSSVDLFESAKAMVTQFLMERIVQLRTANQDSVEGQGLVEYALVILLVAIACILAVTGMGFTVRDELWGDIVDILIPALGG